MLAEITHLHPTLSENEAAPSAPIGLPALARWRVGSLEGGWVTVTATDWLSALGAALYRMGFSDGLQRMACEVLPNGNVIANDITQRRRFSVQQLSATVAIADRFVSADASEDSLGLVDISPDDLTPLDDEEDIATVFASIAL